MENVPNLPQEIIEQIIDHLHNDRASLYACSLASSNLVAVSRCHLFSEVVLTPSSLCKFLQLLDVPWSSICIAISRITFTSNNSTAKHCQGSPRKRRRATGLDHVPECFSRLRENLRNVSSIHLVDITLSKREIPETMWRLLHELNNVKNVEAHRVTFDCPLMFFECIESMTMLDTLSISRANITMDIDGEQMAFLKEYVDRGSKFKTDAKALESSALTTNTDCTYMKIDSHRKNDHVFRMPLLDIRGSSHIPATVPDILAQSFDVGDVDVNNNNQLDTTVLAGVIMVKWLLAQQSIPSVEVLKMDLGCDPLLTAMLAKYCQKTGKNVESLWISLPASIPASEDMLNFDFSHISQVRRLHIDGFLVSHSNTSRELAPFFKLFFRQLFSEGSKLLSGERQTNYTTTSSSYSSILCPRRPSIQKITITLTMDTKSPYSFYGVPDYAVLQSFDWCTLPQIIGKSLEHFPFVYSTLQIQLRVRSATISGKEIEVVEEHIRTTSEWKRFNGNRDHELVGREKLKFVVLSVLNKDEDDDAV